MNMFVDFLLNHTPLLYLTQSLWRDEAFSVWVAQGSIHEVIQATSGDFNPPLYYLLLHFWMQMFGRGEIALRLSSFIAFVVLVFLVYRFAHAVFKRRSTALFAALLTAGNPMLVYFAFELRMYALLTLFATASMYFLYQKKWRWYVLVTAAGLYTQPFMAFVILAQGVYALGTKQLKPIIGAWIGVGILYLPWIATLMRQFAASGPMWMWPISRNLVAAVIANLYFGYEGTPGHLWELMGGLSVVFIGVTLYTLWHEKFAKRMLLFISWTFIPLIAVLGISYFKPVYVHRYVIFVTVGEIFILTTFLHRIKSVRIQTIFALVIFIGTLCANFYAVPYHRKIDFASSFAQINAVITDIDTILVETTLPFYESLYYASDPSHVYLYNPNHIIPPRYVGGVGMPPEIWRDAISVYPAKTFMIHEDGSYSVISQL